MRTALLNRFIMSVYLTDQPLITYFEVDSKVYFIGFVFNVMREKMTSIHAKVIAST